MQPPGHPVQRRLDGADRARTQPLSHVAVTRRRSTDGLRHIRLAGDPRHYSPVIRIGGVPSRERHN